MSLEAGVQLEPCAIASRLSAGGVGEVCLATDRRLNRVAVKILLAGLPAEAQLRPRFEREEKTISQLNHPALRRDNEGLP